MNRAAIAQSAHALWRFFLGYVRAAAGCFIWLQGIALVIYLVRLPFYNDSLETFARQAALFSAVVMGVTIVLMAGFWLFTESLTFRLVLTLLLAISVLGTCTGLPHCVESRYLTC